MRGGEHPVAAGEVVDRGGEQVLGDRPLGGLAVQLAGQRRFARQSLDQDPHAPRGERSAMVVEEVDAVEPQQIRLECLGVLGNELVEAEGSPNDIPVSLP